LIPIRNVCIDFAQNAAQSQGLEHPVEAVKQSGKAASEKAQEYQKKMQHA